MGILDFISDKLNVLHKSGSMPTELSKAGFHFVSMENRKAVAVVSRSAVHVLFDTENYKTKVETDEALALKATQVEMDDIAASVDILSVTKAEKSVVDALQNGIIKQPAVDTYNYTAGGKTSLLSKYPNLTTNEKGWDVLVRNDETKGGKSNRYNWNGTQWVDMETGNYDENVLTKDNVSQQLGESEEDVPSEVAVQNALPVRTASKNLLNINKILHGRLQSSAVGSGIGVAEGWGCIVMSLKDGLVPSETVTLSGDKGRVGIGFYDVENPVETDAKCYRYLSLNIGTFTLDANTKAICINIYSPQEPTYSKVQLEKGSKATDYVPYKQIVKAEVEGLTDIETTAISAKDDAESAKTTANEVNVKMGAFDINKQESTNKANPDNVEAKALISDNDGSLIYTGAAPNYDTFMNIEVEGDTLYSGLTSAGTAQSFRKGAFFDETGKFISGFDTLSKFTTPTNARLFSGSVSNTASGYNPANIGLFKGNSPTWEPYVGNFTIKLHDNTPTDQKEDSSAASIADIKTLLASNSGEQSMSFSISGSQITFNYKNGSITGLIKENRGYNGSSVFNFQSYNINGSNRSNGDDVAPMHIMGTTIGANHGQPLMRGTISNHGKTNEDIGTEWTHTNGTKFYIMRINSVNEILFLSENKGSRTNFSFTSLSVGTLTNGSETMTVTAVGSSQLYPAIKNLTIKVLSNGVSEVSDNGNYAAQYVDIVESYDIMNVDDILSNIKARVGSSDDPVYEGQSMVTVENIYRFLPNTTVLVITNILPQQDIVFSDFMFAQAVTVGTNTKYYIPNSLPNGAYDFRKPLYVAWSSSIPSMYFGSATWKDTANPINRILQYSDNIGFALGFLKSAGVGKALQNFTNRTFEIRNNTGKVYPHGVEGTKVGTTLHKGDIYNAVMYRTFIDVPNVATDSRLSFYNFSYNGAEYVYADYSATTLDRIIINNSLNGKKIEIVEGVNTTLKSDVYNNGIYINANYVEGETCFIVLKIF